MLFSFVVKLSHYPSPRLTVGHLT